MDGNHVIIDNKPILSIVVPSYNCEKTLERTAKSLLCQEANAANGELYQIVLVDDGSPDNTPAICDALASEHPCITVIHKKNGGLVDAWKTGVRNSDGEYIAFCDSDDYVEPDFVKTMISEIESDYADLIVFGVSTDYETGESLKHDVLLREGLYDEGSIKETLFPQLMSNGDMQTELIGSSRCNKVFKRSLLLEIMDDIPESISFGEDDVTCLAAVLRAKSIKCINRYYPYHYVRNNASMIGVYDIKIFEKIEKLYMTLKAISEKYSYPYTQQIEMLILSISFLYIKKEICKNPNGYKNAKIRIEAFLNSDTFLDCYEKKRIKKYGITKRLFANMIVKGFLRFPYYSLRVFEGIRGRNV